MTVSKETTKSVSITESVKRPPQMEQPKIVSWSSKEIEVLRRRFEKLAETTPFDQDLTLAAKIASYGIYREIGTPNDELARFIFDVETQKPVEPSSLQANFVEWKGLFGLQINSKQTKNMELRARGFYDVVHPKLSQNADGTLHSLFIFPQIIHQIVQAQGVELVLVKSWGMNSIFGGFNPAQGYYQTNFWELQNNDTVTFSNLVRQRKLAFMGTHDLIAHIAGVDDQSWQHLQKKAEEVYQKLNHYFQSVKKPSIAGLILPYTIGVVLDDLAQPPSYNSKSHLAVLDELLYQFQKNTIPADLPTILKEFPQSFQKIIETSRLSLSENRISAIKLIVQSLIQEIRMASLQI